MKKTRKFDVGGISALARPMGPPSQQRMDAGRAARDAHHQMVAGRKQFGIGTPERQNYKNYMRSVPSDATNIPAYNPSATYAAAPKGDSAAKVVAQPSAPRATGLGNPVRMKKGGAVSASKRGDGIAQRGKTKGRMV